MLRLAWEWMSENLPTSNHKWGCVCFGVCFHQSVCPLSVSSTYILGFTQRSPCPAVCRAIPAFLFSHSFLLQCQGLVWHLLTLCLPNDEDSCWKTERVLTMLKPNTHTADAPHPCPPPISARVKKKNPWEVPSDLGGCERKNVWF